MNQKCLRTPETSALAIVYQSLIGSRPTESPVAAMLSWPFGKKKGPGDAALEAALGDTPAKGGGPWDPSGLERAAKAVRELNSSPHAERAYDVVLEQERTKQHEVQLRQATYELQGMQHDMQRVQAEAEEARKTLKMKTERANQNAEYADRLERERYIQQTKHQQALREQELVKQERAWEEREKARRETIKHQSQLEMKRVLAKVQVRANAGRAGAPVGARGGVRSLRRARHPAVLECWRAPADAFSTLFERPEHTGISLMRLRLYALMATRITRASTRVGGGVWGSGARVGGRGDGGSTRGRELRHRVTREPLPPPQPRGLSRAARARCRFLGSARSRASQAEVSGKIEQERANHDLILAKTKAEGAETRQTRLESIKLATETFGAGVREFLVDRERMTAAVGLISAVALGVYGARVRQTPCPLLQGEHVTPGATCARATGFDRGGRALHRGACRCGGVGGGGAPTHARTNQHLSPGAPWKTFACARDVAHIAPRRAARADTDRTSGSWHPRRQRRRERRARGCRPRAAAR